MSESDRPVIVVGGGLAGLAASARIAESGHRVRLFSVVPVKRSHSVCAQGGINATNPIAEQQGFSAWKHMDETLYGGDFLAHQPPVREMCRHAPRIIHLLDRMGVPFNRTAEGNYDLRAFGGSLFKRTHFAGSTTGQQLMYALDEQVRRHEAAGMVEKYEFWDFLRPVLDDDGRCRGIVAENMDSMEIRAFPADAVVLATGGCGAIFGRSTNSLICNGAAAARAYRHGATLGNPEFIQVHPTSIPGQDKNRLMSEAARGEGGRVWVPRDPGDGRDPRSIPEAERWYFLEERYPAYGNLVPRDIASREIFDVCRSGYGVGGARMVYLDVTHLPQETKDKLRGILEIYQKFTGEDPTEVPIKIFPTVHYTMGGLWTGYEPAEDGEGLAQGAPGNMMTDVPGLYAFGEVNYQYHGATRLGANALLNCIFDGLYCGLSVAREAERVGGELGEPAEETLRAAADAERERARAMLAREAGENPYALHEEMGEWMTDECTVVREEKGLERARDALRDLKERAARAAPPDASGWSNQSLSFTRALEDMIRYAEAIVAASIERRESRGSHYRTDYPERDDERYLQTTVATYDSQADEPRIGFEAIRMGLVEPRARTYGKKAASGSGESGKSSGGGS